MESFLKQSTLKFPTHSSVTKDLITKYDPSPREFIQNHFNSPFTRKAVSSKIQPYSTFSLSTHFPLFNFNPHLHWMSNNQRYLNTIH